MLKIMIMIMAFKIIILNRVIKEFAIYLVFLPI